jgi:hypothetical protein
MLNKPVQKSIRLFTLNADVTISSTKRREFRSSYTSLRRAMNGAIRQPVSRAVDNTPVALPLCNRTARCNTIIYIVQDATRPPLWSTGQSSWLQIQRPGLDSRRYQVFWEVVGLKQGPFSIVSTSEELLERKSSGSGLEIRKYGRRDPSRWPRAPFTRKSWH